MINRKLNRGPDSQINKMSVTEMLWAADRDKLCSTTAEAKTSATADGNHTIRNTRGKKTNERACWEGGRLTHTRGTIDEVRLQGRSPGKRHPRSVPFPGEPHHPLSSSLP